MNLQKLLLSVSCGLAVAAFSGSAIAQNTLPATPVDGQMVRLDAQKMWKLSYLPNQPVYDAQKIASDVYFPSISPDGARVVMFARGIDVEDNHLQEWSLESRKVREIVRGADVSMFTAWDDDETISYREREKPFFRNGAKLRYSLKKKPALRDRKPMADATFVAYDESDIIILESKKTKTLQAISDTRADRYFSPIVSPDEKYVVFMGLTSGVHLFDIEANTVVFIGSNGSNPSFSPDGRYLIYANTRDDGHDYTSGDLILLDLQTRQIRTLANPNNEIRIMGTVSRDARFVAYATADGTNFRASLVSQ